LLEVVGHPGLHYFMSAVNSDILLMSNRLFSPTSKGSMRFQIEPMAALVPVFISVLLEKKRMRNEAN